MLKDEKLKNNNGLDIPVLNGVWLYKKWLLFFIYLFIFLTQMVHIHLLYTVSIMTLFPAQWINLPMLNTDDASSK